MVRAVPGSRRVRSRVFRQAVDVDRVEVHPLLDLGPHVVGPGLRAEDAQAQAGGARVQPLALEFVGDRQHVAGRDHDDVGPEVGHQLHLPLGLAAAEGHHGQPELLGAVVRTQAAGEQAVAVAHVHHVARPGAGGADAARHHLRPGLDVAPGVADHRRLAGGAAGGVDAHALLARHREHAEGIGAAQVGLAGEGKPAQVGQRAQVVGVHAVRIEAGAVHRRVAVRVPQRRLQPLELQRVQLVDAGGLDRLAWKGPHG